MRVRAFSIVSLFLFLFAAAILPAAAQTILATVPVGQDAFYLAANPVTNKIYVANYCGNDPGCGSTSPGTVTVIDGLTNTVDRNHHGWDSPSIPADQSRDQQDLCP